MQQTRVLQLASFRGDSETILKWRKMTFVLYFLFISSGIPQYSEMGKYETVEACQKAGAEVVKSYASLKYVANYACLQRSTP